MTYRNKAIYKINDGLVTMPCSMTPLLDSAESFLFCKKTEDRSILFVRDERYMRQYISIEEMQCFTEKDFYEEIVFTSQKDFFDYIASKYPYADLSRASFT